MIPAIARLLLALFTLALSSPAVAQNTPRRLAAIGGVVRDSASGRAVQKASVCTLIPAGPSLLSQRCGVVDSTGRYRLDSLPLRSLRISVQCETLRGLGKALASDSVVFTDTVLVRRDWLVSRTGCDPRPVRRVTGVFRGHYTSGFEASEFIPCAADGWFIPGDSLDTYPFNARRAWVTWPAAVGESVKWPDAARDRYGNSRYYVKWRGTVVGPGRYGHMGVSTFEFQVDTVLELRIPGRRDCR